MRYGVGVHRVSSKSLPGLDGRSGRNGGQGSIEETEIFILRWDLLGSDLVGERRFSVGTGGQRGTWWCFDQSQTSGAVVTLLPTLWPSGTSVRAPHRRGYGDTGCERGSWGQSRHTGSKLGARPTTPRGGGIQGGALLIHHSSGGTRSR